MQNFHTSDQRSHPDYILFVAPGYIWNVRLGSDYIDLVAITDLLGSINIHKITMHKLDFVMKMKSILVSSPH